MKRAALLLWLAAAGTSLAAELQTLGMRTDSPLVSFRILFQTGAAQDPDGHEGVAALTAAMLTKGGTKAMSYDDVVEELFPMAASVNAQVDKEMTVFHGSTHVDNLDRYYGLLRAMLLKPGWREDDFRRVKDEAMNFLRIQLRSNNEEELGKEFLYLNVYKDHPYGHQSAGTLAALRKLTVDDLKSFYADNYRQGSLVIGLAGGYPEGFLERVKADFARLPEGAVEPVQLSEPVRPNKLQIKIIRKETRGTLISLGFPISVTRGSPDWPALQLVQSYFGQHRSSKSYLFQQIREIRGMNDGDYAYIEYFPRGMFQSRPDPNLGRHQQIFQIWIRPVTPNNGLFALRIALYELDKLVKQGLAEQDFESTRRFLTKYVNLLAPTQSDQLGYALDSRFYGTPPFSTYLKEALKNLTVSQVNEAIRKHLRSTGLEIAIITKDAEGMRQEILSGRPSTIEYASPPPDEILEEDRVIGRYKLDVGSVEVVPVDTIFEN